MMLNKGGLEALMVMGGVILLILGGVASFAGLGMLLGGYIAFGATLFIVGGVLFAFIIYRFGSHLHNYENECRKQYNLPPK